ncbi:unnamed protein product, partial [Didymodactylos carnosus]
QWFIPFSKDLTTTTKSFQKAKTNTVNVQMTQIVSEFSYINATDSIQAQIVEIPFSTTRNNKNLQLVFTIILPNEGVTLATYLSSYHYQNSKTQSAFDLKKPLQTANVTDVFDKTEANLKGISPSQPSPLYVTDVIHQAIIDVDENGVTAAAVTAIIIGPGFIDPPRSEQIVFNYNRPFLYLILEKTSGLVIFVGTYYGK